MSYLNNLWGEYSGCWAEGELTTHFTQVYKYGVCAIDQNSEIDISNPEHLPITFPQCNAHQSWSGRIIIILDIFVITSG